MSGADGFMTIVERLILEGDVEETVDQIVAYAATALETPHVGITLQHAGGRRLESIGPTTDVVSRADDAQHDLHEGPCVDTATELGTVWSGDLGHDARWPRWGPRAESLGLRSIVSTGLATQGRKVGGLNVYGERPHQFDSESATVLRELAQHAVVALVAARRTSDLETALGTRAVIGQAQGILMERHQIDADAAFSVLRRYSQDENVKLHWVAEEVVRTLDLPPSR